MSTISQREERRRQPRTVEITVPPERSETLIADLTDLGTLSLRMHRGASLQPRGDVVAVDVTDAIWPR